MSCVLQWEAELGYEGVTVVPGGWGWRPWRLLRSVWFWCRSHARRSEPNGDATCLQTRGAIYYASVYPSPWSQYPMHTVPYGSVVNSSFGTVISQGGATYPPQFPGLSSASVCPVLSCPVPYPLFAPLSLSLSYICFFLGLTDVSSSLDLDVPLPHLPSTSRARYSITRDVASALPLHVPPASQVRAGVPPGQATYFVPCLMPVNANGEQQGGIVMAPGAQPFPIPNSSLNIKPEKKRRRVDDGKDR
eukprot:750256-Hanusia_phi.AAC.1